MHRQGAASFEGWGDDSRGADGPWRSVSVSLVQWLAHWPAAQAWAVSAAGPTFADIERALDAGKLEMMRPWGDWVPVRRHGRTVQASRTIRHLEVWMENEVEALISSNEEQYGFPHCRIVG